MVDPVVVRRQVEITNVLGLHLRPADKFVKLAGRFQSEMTDVDTKAVKIGDRVAMTVRRLITAGGVHNYFWKAKPLRGGQS